MSGTRTHRQGYAEPGHQNLPSGTRLATLIDCDDRVDTRRELPLDTPPPLDPNQSGGDGVQLVVHGWVAPISDLQYPPGNGG